MVYVCEKSVVYKYKQHLLLGFRTSCVVGLPQGKNNIVPNRSMTCWLNINHYS